MHTPTQTERQTLDAAIDAAAAFISGFEDDSTQDGVPAQILAQLRAVASEQAIVLEPFSHTQPRWWGNSNSCNIEGHSQIDTWYQRVHGTDWPAPWYGRLGMGDKMGRTWQRTFRAVIDDFGNLVEVPQ